MSTSDGFGSVCVEIARSRLNCVVATCVPEHLIRDSGPCFVLAVSESFWIDGDELGIFKLAFPVKNTFL